MPRTPIHATTLHWLFALSVEGESRLDPSNPHDEGTQRLSRMTVLVVDEAGMIDDRTCRAIRDQLSSVGATHGDAAQRTHPHGDVFGRVHILMAMDLKQLPPATANPVFLAADAEFREHFGFRVLTENRRLV